MFNRNSLSTFRAVAWFARSPETASARRDRECGAQAINSRKRDAQPIRSGRSGPTEVPIDILALLNFPRDPETSFRQRKQVPESLRIAAIFAARFAGSVFN